MVDSNISKGGVGRGSSPTDQQSPVGSRQSAGLDPDLLRTSPLARQTACCLSTGDWRLATVDRSGYCSGCQRLLKLARENQHADDNKSDCGDTLDPDKWKI